MDEPLEVQGIDASGADPALRNAPLAVRKADVWLQDHNRRPARKWAIAATAMLPIAGLVGGGLLASMTGAEGPGAMLMLASWGASGAGLYLIHRAWGGTAAWASTLVQRYRELQEMGLSPAMPEEALGESAGAIDRLASRIEALADGRPDLLNAVQAAREHVVRLQGELRHIDDVATGDPDADAALDAARERLLAEVSGTRARVAEAYAALLELQAGASSDVMGELEASLQRLGAEVEVEDAAGARARPKRERA